MTVTTVTRTPALAVKVNDIVDGLKVTKKRTLNVNVELTFDDGLGNSKTRRVRNDVEVEVVRQVNTWQDEIDKARVGLQQGVDEVRKSVNAAEANEAAIKWAEKLNEKVTASNMLYRLGWDTLTMATELQFEVLLQQLGHRLTDELEERHATVILRYVERMKEELLDWRIGRSTSASSNLMDEAKHDAIREFVKGGFNGFSRVQFYNEYVKRLEAAAPEDRNEPFTQDRFNMMEDR